MKIKSFFKVPEANAEIARLTTELSTKDAEINRLTALVGDRDSQLSTKDQEIHTLQETVKAKDVEINGLKASATTVEQAAAVQAATIVAGVGVQTPVAAASEGNKTREQLWAEYRALPISERNAFYAKNKAAMRE